MRVWITVSVLVMGLLTASPGYQGHGVAASALTDALVLDDPSASDMPPVDPSQAIRDELAWGDADVEPPELPAPDPFEGSPASAPPIGVPPVLPVAEPPPVQWASGPPPLLSNNALAMAQTLLGIPYVWGGNTQGGMDCSAYVSRAWGLSRQTTDTLHRYAEAITKDDLRPGDIMNLTTSQDPRHYGHVRLFAAWANAERTRMWVYEETPRQSVYHVIAYDARYTPMRRTNIVLDAGEAPLIPAPEPVQPPTRTPTPRSTGTPRPLVASSIATPAATAGRPASPAAAFAVTRTPSPTPTRTPSPSPSPTRTPSRTPSPTPSPTPTRTPSPTPTTTPSPSPTPTATPSPTPTPTPAPTATSTPTPTRAPFRNRTSRAQPTAVPTAAATPAPAPAGTRR